MGEIIFNPNPNDCTVTLGGGGSGEISEGSTLYVSCARKNWELSTNPMPHWETKYGGGWDPSTYRVEGVVNDGYKMVAGFINQTMPIDASTGTANGITISIHALKDNDTIDVNAGIYLCSNMTWELTTTNSRGESTQTTGTTQSFSLGGYNPQWSGAAPKVEGSITSNIPIFDTIAHADAYLLTGDTEGLINTAEPLPDNQDYDYYMYNSVSKNGIKPYNDMFYRYKMTTNGRLALYLETAGTHPEADRILVGVENINKIYKGDNIDDPVFPESTSTSKYFLGNTLGWSDGTVYIPYLYDTNILTFKTKADAEEYILTGDPSKAIDQWRETGVVDPEIGEPTDQTEQGENGAVFSYGNHIYRMSNVQMATFFNEVFNTDPTITQALLDGLQLFGSNQINAIHDIMYLPLSVSDIATLSGTTNITIGTYTMQNAQGDPVVKNDKMINMGTHFFAAPYGARDYRNYAPYCRAYVMLPYAGTHELQIDKYINKNVTIKLAVDVTTGAGTYYIYGNQTIFDTFDCIIGAHRPITAVDHASHVSATTNAVLQTLPSVGQAVVSVGNPTAGGIASAAANTAGAVLKGYEAMNTAVNAPMTERGSFHGFISMFDVTSPYFIFAQMQTKAPQNLLMIKGKPSSAGGKLSSFWGRFEAAEVDLPAFSGTQAEAEELISILKGGVYID